MQVHVEMDRQEYRQKADEARDQGEPGNGHRPDLRCDNPRDHRSDERAPSGAGSASRHGANESALFHPDVVESGSSVESDRRTRQERTVVAERLLTPGSSFETTRQPPWETVSHLSRLGVARAAQSALAQCYWR